METVGHAASRRHVRHRAASGRRAGAVHRRGAAGVLLARARRFDVRARSLPTRQHPHPRASAGAAAVRPVARRTPADRRRDLLAQAVRGDPLARGRRRGRGRGREVRPAAERAVLAARDPGCTTSSAVAMSRSPRGRRVERGSPSSARPGRSAVRSSSRSPKPGTTSSRSRGARASRPIARIDARRGRCGDAERDRRRARRAPTSSTTSCTRSGSRRLRGARPAAPRTRSPRGRRRAARGRSSTSAGSAATATSDLSPHLRSRAETARTPRRREQCR